MTKRRKIILWLGLVLSLPASCYTGLSMVFYAWLSMTEPQRWPPDTAGIWLAAAATGSMLAIGCFIYCLVSLIKGVNSEYRAKQHNLLCKQDAP